MKKIVFVLLILSVSIAFSIEGTVRFWSADKNTRIRRADEEDWYYAPEVTGYGAIHGWDGLWDPPHWRKTYNDDGTRWISWNINGGTDMGHRNHYYRRQIILPFPPPGDSYYISRATLWMDCDDWDSVFYWKSGTRYFVAIHPNLGHGNFVDSLYRIDLTDYFDIGPYLPCWPISTIEIFVRDISHDQWEGLIYYVSIDYGPKEKYYPLDGIADESGYWSVSLPARIVSPTSSLRNLYFGRMLQGYILNPATQNWRFLDIDQPITGAFADTIRTYSTFGIFLFDEINPPENVKFTGIPIFEQRYLDLQPWRWAGSENRWYPVGSVQCDIPFHWWSSSEPDDLPPYCWNGLRGYNGSVYPSDDWDIFPFDGYIASINRPDYPQTGHLDLRCYSLRFGIDNPVASLDDYREAFPDEVFIDSYPPETEPTTPDTSAQTAETLAGTEDTDEPFYVPPINPPPPVPEAPGFYKKGTEINSSNLPPLLCNFPNPFNAATEIFYVLFGDDEQPVEIEVYDLSGHRIRTLFKGTQQSGNHSIVWNGTDDIGRKLGTGTYLIRINSAGRSFIQKALLIR